MNERIRELIKSLGIIPEDEHYEVAELIVRECVGLTDQWPDTVRQVMSRQIKDHFGVE